MLFIFLEIFHQIKIQSSFNLDPIDFHHMERKRQFKISYSHKGLELCKGKWWQNLHFWV